VGRMTKAAPNEAVAMRLAKIFPRGDLRLCETIVFAAGAPGIDTVLRRAGISGNVEVGGEIDDHFADLLDGDHSIVETVALDSKSFAALKNHWMRCRYVSHEIAGRRALAEKGE
jgi:hypothetical protein